MRTRRDHSPLLALLAWPRHRCDDGARPRIDGLHGVKLVPPHAKPDFTLETRMASRSTSRRDTHGKVTLLYFGYTNCPDVCPLHLANIASGAQAVGAGRSGAACGSSS